MERDGLFLCFLLIAAGQDIRNKQVELRVFIIFGLLAVLLCGYQWYTGGWNGWLEIAGNLCIAAGMLGASFLCRGSIGTGDGCFFLVSGLLLSFWENMALLFYGVMLCGSCCLIKLVYHQICDGKATRNQTVPFLPFLVPAGIWLVFVN